MQYQGFRIRFPAYVIDSTAISIISWIFYQIMYLLPINPTALFFISFFGGLFLGAVYIIVPTSRWGGTPGKLLMRLKVVDAAGKNVSIKTATVRMLGMILSDLILGIGFLMIVWDQQKQSLHDKVAHTYVIENETSKISRRMRKIIIVVVMLSLLAIIILGIILIGQIFQSIQSTTAEFSSADELITRCNAYVWFQKDLCFQGSFSSSSFSALTKDDQLRVCTSTGSDQLESACLWQIATKTMNPAICDKGSLVAAKMCHQQLDFLKNLLNITKPTDQWTGSLSAEGLDIGYRFDDYCYIKSTTSFGQHDTICWEFRNVSGFVLGKDDLHHYDLHVTTYTSDGDFVDESRNVYENKMEFLKNGTLEKESFITNLSYFRPGSYVLQITLFDVVSKKAIVFNRSITIRATDEGNLTLTSLRWGYFTGYYCVFDNVTVFAPGETTCLLPEVDGFDVVHYPNVRTGMLIFDIDEKVYNQEGELQLYNKDIFNTYVYIGTSLHAQTTHIPIDFSPGSYIVENRIRDLVSGKQLFIRIPIEVKNQPQRPRFPDEKDGDVQYPDVNVTTIFSVNGQDVPVTVLSLADYPQRRATINVSGTVLTLNEGEQTTIGSVGVSLFRVVNEFVDNKDSYVGMTVFDLRTLS